VRFIYQYRTSDNTQHEGVVRAASRDAAYAVLKERGIRPSRVEEAPGFFNKLFGKGKRWIAIVVLATLAAMAVFYARWTREAAQEAVEEAKAVAFAPTDRHQIYGEPALMQEMASSGYAGVFTHPGDRYLAHFAQPGVVAKFASVNWRTEMAESLKDVLKSEVSFSEADVREVRELKQIVAGMRGELREYLANGVGTYESFVKRMEERQVRENLIYLQTKKELTNETDPDVFDKRNAALRRMGLQTVSMPE
jgi:hypothetical protein